MTDPLYEPLERLYQRFDYRSRIQEDPVSFVHQVTAPHDQEIVGLIASALAYGQAKLFKQKIQVLMTRMTQKGGPRAYVEHFEWADEKVFLEDFRYRVTPGRDIGRLFYALKVLIERHGSLEAAFLAGFSPKHKNIGLALEAFVESIYKIGDPPERSARHTSDTRGPPAPHITNPPGRSFRHLVPSPRLGSACKRLNLYLRWMVRTQPGLDVGIWRQIPTSHLVLPLDTHTLRLSHNLGLTNRTSQTWRTAEEITGRLRQLDPNDPVKYDFALCHLGMAGKCPQKRNPSRCLACEINGICSAI